MRILRASVALVAAVSLMFPFPVGGGPPRATASDTATAPTAAAAKQPNIIFFLTDDESLSQLRYMPNTRHFIFDRGARFTDYFTDVGLCCAARASIFTGKYAHNTGILGNEYPDGFRGFHDGDENKDTFAISLHDAGYRTALLGKYLNEYPDVESSPSHAVAKTYVPDGWSDWFVPVTGECAGTSYELNHDGRLSRHRGPHAYLGDRMESHLLHLIDANTDGQGLMAEFSSFAPHYPMPTSPIELHNKRLNRRIEAIRYPRTPDFDEADVSDKPEHIRRRARLTKPYIAKIDRFYRRQVLSDLSIDRYVGAVHRELRRTHQLDNTYLVFTSDNGFHMGNHRLPIGKDTAYDPDIKLPLAIAGPGITPGTRVGDLTANIDLAPTFTDMAGLPPAASYDGRSLLPLAQGDPVAGWRKYFVIQRGYVTSYGAVDSGEEPGFPGESHEELSRSPYVGIVGKRYRYIDNKRGEDELYDTRTDPFEVDNLLAGPDRTLAAATRAELTRVRAARKALLDCRGATACSVR